MGLTLGLFLFMLIFLGPLFVAMGMMFALLGGGVSLLRKVQTGEYWRYGLRLAVVGIGLAVLGTGLMLFVGTSVLFGLPRWSAPVVGLILSVAGIATVGMSLRIYVPRMWP